MPWRAGAHVPDLCKSLQLFLHTGILGEYSDPWHILYIKNTSFHSISSKGTMKELNIYNIVTQMGSAYMEVKH